MNIDSILNGIVIDHIQAKKGIEIYEALNLKELDCSHSYLLGTGVGAQSLDLSGCRNLRNIDISYTKLTGS